eukprot:2549408-Amphidinium_carterae.1
MAASLSPNCDTLPRDTRVSLGLLHITCSISYAMIDSKPCKVIDFKTVSRPLYWPSGITPRAISHERFMNCTNLEGMLEKVRGNEDRENLSYIGK